jgi:hypothetical protein
MLFGHQGQLYVTKSQKGTYIVGLVCSDRILLAKGGLIVTNSNNYSFGNHFFKVLVQIHYSQYKQLLGRLYYSFSLCAFKAIGHRVNLYVTLKGKVM